MDYSMTGDINVMIVNVILWDVSWVTRAFFPDR